MAQLNEEQRQAVYAPAKTLVVTAGAGTGKTSVLTHRYLHLITSSEKPIQKAQDKVVAITFTRKATAEMKHRIGTMGRELNLDLNEAQVQTIDSFFLELVKEYALHLDLDPALEVLDGVELEDMLKASVSKVMTENIEKNPDLPPLLKLMNVRRDQFESGLKLVYEKMRQREDIRQLTPEDLKGDPKLVGEVLEEGDLSISEDKYYTYQKLILHMVKYVDRDFFERKRSQGKLDYTDVLDLALTLMDRETICREVSDKYGHILIDEFQDTNRRQSQVFKKLFEAGSHLFIVGDGKQSIYGFRGSDLKASEEMHQYLKSHGAQMVVLSKNYRSNTSYLDPVNACFENLFSNYDPVDPQVESGETKFISLINEKSELTGQELEAEVMTEKILELSKTQSLDKVALLFRRSTHMALYEKALRKRNIPFKNTHGKDFFTQREIMDLILLLRTVVDPEDKLAYFGYLRSPYVNLTDESIYVHMVLGREAPSQERVRLVQSEDQLKKWRSLSRGTSTFHLLSEIFKDTKILDYYHYTLKDSHAVNRLTKILDISLKYDQEDPNGLMGLLKVLDNMDQEGQMNVESSGKNAVTLSTIHGSKGLEYEVIFLPDVNSDLRKTRDLLNFSREYGLRIKFDQVDPIYEANVDLQIDWETEELLRLFYVAVTRAKKQLIIGPPAKKSKGLAQLLEGLPFEEEEIDLNSPGLKEEKPVETWELKTFEPKLKKPTLTASYLLNLQEKEEATPGTPHQRGHIIGNLIHAYAQEMDGCEDNGCLREIIDRSPVKLNPQEEKRLELLAANYRKTLKGEKVLVRELPFLLDMEDFYLKGSIDQVRDRDGKLYLVDLKTNWSGGTEENINYYSPQLQLYGLAFEALTGEPLAGLELLFLQDESRISIPKASDQELRDRVSNYLKTQGGGLDS